MTKHVPEVEHKNRYHQQKSGYMEGKVKPLRGSVTNQHFAMDHHGGKKSDKTEDHDEADIETLHEQIRLLSDLWEFIFHVNECLPAFAVPRTTFPDAYGDAGERRSARW